MFCLRVVGEVVDHNVRTSIMGVHMAILFDENPVETIGKYVNLDGLLAPQFSLPFIASKATTDKALKITNSYARYQSVLIEKVSRNYIE